MRYPLCVENYYVEKKITPFWQICSTLQPYITQTNFLITMGQPSYDHINDSSLQLQSVR